MTLSNAFALIDSACSSRRRAGISPRAIECPRRNVHCGRNRIIAGLSHVDIIIGMNRIFRSDNTPEDLNRTIRDHLVGIHIGRSPGPCLKDVEHELLVKTAVYDFLCRLNNGAPDLLIE